VILDLEKFIAEQREVWRELDELLSVREKDPAAGMDLEQVKRFHHLYQRASADLAKLRSFASEPELKGYLESLVARGFGEIHETRQRAHRIAAFDWLFRCLPQTFRRRIWAFRTAVAATLLGVVFGAAMLSINPETKDVLLPFQHLQGSPSERVAREERGINRSLEDRKLTFSSQLMTHNMQVAILCMAMGTTWGIGTIVLLFYNGVILGAVAADYLIAGQASFLFGWLLPHGSVEITAILISGQAGLVLAAALLGRESALPLAERLRRTSADLVTLLGCAGMMLIWAGIIEAFFSQYHEPVVSYSLKIGFGVMELLAVVLFLNHGTATGCGRITPNAQWPNKSPDHKNPGGH